MREMCIHVGYPKTATTTLQRHLFSHHPEIEYLGKFIPGYGYITPSLACAVNELISHDEIHYCGVTHLRELLDPIRTQSGSSTLLLSSESMIHPWATDRGVVARRISEAFSPCRILITIREQRDSIKSFYGRHGRFCQYLFLQKDESERLRSPLSFREWFSYCMRSLDKNFLGVLQYYETVQFYVDLFGRDNVGVFLFEEFLEDKKGFLGKLCRFLRIKDVEKAEALLDGKHELPKFSRMEVLQGGVVPTLLPWSKRADSPGPMKQQPNFFRRAFGTPTITLDPSHLQQLHQLYGEGNRRLQETYQLPLQQCGYLLSR